jgi:hypothetical protein
VGHVLHSGASKARNVDTLFFMLGWDRCRFHKKCVGTRYVELMFLHPMRSVGHVVHFGVSRERNVDTLLFMLGWDQYGFNKNCVGTRYSKLLFLHPV